MQVHVNEATSAAPPEAVWEVLSDHAGMARWAGGIFRSRRVSSGAPEPDGAGAVRALLTVGGPVREEIVAFERPVVLTYRAVSGLPTVRDYLGEVELSPTPDGGTRIRWRTSFRVPPLVGAVTAFLVARGTRTLARDLAAEADRRAGA